MLNPPQNVRLIADVVDIEKDEKGQIGIAIGGGAPHCPCLYVVQIFENSPARKNGLLGVGDEIVAVNGKVLKGYEKNAVASMIRDVKGVVRISFNRLYLVADTDVVQTLDILLKKFKHRLVDSMDEATADALGFSRAILCNDVLAQLKTRMDQKQQFYGTLIKKSGEMARCYQQMAATQSAVGSVLAEIQAKERPSSEGDVANDIGQVTSDLAPTHKILAKEHLTVAQNIEEMVRTLQCHANAAIPDARQSLSKYLDAKYEFLAYCLRTKELEDEEAETAFENGEQLMRMETGNYEYRMTLKKRDQSRISFMEKREKAAVKIELLDEKHVRELALHLKTLMNSLKMAHFASRKELIKVK
ncbi:hypothetical protein niasHT_034591 [Heterodera trifolii]|uniref:PRKCA-binding protein n=1 Tax=Heterodera trifolii TaxID=157864 RepID=A0ABD2IV02_9BILA